MKNVSDYWFTIEPYVFVDIKSKHILLYNTLDGVTIESTNEKIVELLQETLQEKKLRCRFIDSRTISAGRDLLFC
mgnify:FL=1